MVVKVNKERRTFSTEAEREQETRIKNCKHQQDKRKRDKEKVVLNSKYIKLPVRAVYRKSFYKGLRTKDFNQFITFTCKYSMPLGWVINKTKLFIDNLKANGLVGNYFLVFEYNGNDYHVHILLYTVDKLGIQEAVNGWNHGTTKIIDVVDQSSKEDHITYCTKQLIPDSTSHRMQSLIDAWELYLTPETDNVSKVMDTVIVPMENVVNEPDAAVTDAVNPVDKEPFISPAGDPDIITTEVVNQITVKSMTVLTGIVYMLWMIVKEQFKEKFMAGFMELMYLY